MSAEIVAKFIHSMDFNDLPDDVVSQAKVAVRDVLGVMIAGYFDRASEVMRKVAAKIGGIEESTIIGLHEKAPSCISTWVNAVQASTLDFDDGSFGREGHRGHPGCMVIPASLAFAEKQNSTGKEFITSVVAGYEVALRAGWMIGAGLKDKETGKRTGGGTPASLPGVYGVAASVSKLLGHSTNLIAAGLGLAESHRPFPIPATVCRDKSPAHIDEWAKHTPMTKENCGWAAMTGASSVIMAEAGFEGGSTIFDLHEYVREPLKTLGKEWEILRLYFKPYSVCRGLHSAIYGTLKIVEEHDLKAENITSVTANVNDQESRFNGYRPTTRYNAQMSIPFAVGAALLEGEVTPKQISWERIADKAILRQADKVSVVSDPSLNSAVTANVEIETTSGEKYKTYIEYVLGEPENPLSEDALLRKFKNLTEESLGARKVDEILGCLDNLEGLGNVNELVSRIRYVS